MPILYNWAEMALEETGSSTAVHKRRIAGRGADMIRIEIAAGTKADRHSHPHEQFVQVLSGHGTLETEEGRQAFSAGSVFHFPAETWHAAEFDDATVLIETNLRA